MEEAIEHTQAQRRETPKVESCNPMQLNPFPLRITPRGALQHNATQLRSSYNRRPLARRLFPVQSIAGAYLCGGRLFQQFSQKFARELNSIASHPFPRSQGKSLPRTRYGGGMGVPFALSLSCARSKGLS